MTTIGAIAGAVAAIKALWPTPDPENSAHVVARTASPMSLREYISRLENSLTQEIFRNDVLSIQESSSAADNTPTAGTDQATTEIPTCEDPGDVCETAAPSGTVSSESGSNPTSKGSGAPSLTTPTTSSAAFRTLGSGFKKSPGLTQDRMNTVARLLSGYTAICRDLPHTASCAHTLLRLARGVGSQQISSNTICALIHGVTLDSNGEPVLPKVAAQRIVKIFRDARQDSAKQPTGVLVSVDLELVGLRGKTLLLSWSMWRSGDGAQLHDEWLNTYLAYQLEPTTEHDTTTVDLWVPLPAAPGPYYIRTDLIADGTRLASDDSLPFS
ncbi:MAG TPA: hypothetical protein VH969_27940 [Actinophytocola sp.]|uniref:hypothetical protein n=1 Tax=Actinophytocola sp. TaxID=1872138 RepID=UPI002F945D6A